LERQGRGVDLAGDCLLRSGPEKSTPSPGFDSDGGTWVFDGATFTPGTSIETGTQTAPDGKTSTFRNTWIVSADGYVHLGKTRGGAGRCSLDGIHGQGNQDQASLRKIGRTLEAAYKQSKEPCYENTRQIDSGCLFLPEWSLPSNRTSRRKPGPELQKLQLWVGEWTYEGESPTTFLGPGRKNSLAE